MKINNATTPVKVAFLVAAITAASLLSLSANVEASAAPANPKLPPNIEALPGQVLQDTIRDANRCNPYSIYYRPFDCGGGFLNRSPQIRFLNAAGQEVSLEEFSQQTHQPPEAHGFYRNPDGSIELK